jgi:outer membrane cobalamin receptor
VAYAADYFYNHLSTHIATADGVSRNTLMQALSLRYKQKRWTATARMVAHRVWNKVPRQYSEALQQAARGMHKWQPSVSAVYRMDEYGLAFRAFYKDYYRQPTFSENYFYHLGTAQLKPERTRQVGGGITWQENVGNVALKATADAYYNDISDRITSVPYNLFVWRTENRGKVTITGLDATLHANCRMNAQHQFIVAANYSLQKSEDITSSADNNYGKQPAYLPQHSGAVSITWENPWVNLNVGLTAASERWSTHNHASQTRLPGYAEINASLLRSFPCGKGVLTAGLFLNNALDKSYEVIRRYPMPLRNVMFKVGWGF